jgi:hypothetical protein
MRQVFFDRMGQLKLNSVEEAGVRPGATDDPGNCIHYSPLANIFRKLLRIPALRTV